MRLRYINIETTNVPKAIQWSLLLFALSCLGIGAIGFWKAIHIGIIPDEGVFGEGARLIASSQGLPYRDLWDHKPPLIFYWLAPFVRIFGNTSLPIKLAAVVVGIWFSTIMGLLAGTLSHSHLTAGFAFVLSWAYSGIITYLMGSETTYLMATLGATAMLLAVLSRGRPIWTLGAGMAFALGFFAKQPLITDLPILFLLVFYSAPPSHRIQALTGASIGIGIIVGGTILWAVWNNLLGDFWTQAFLANFTYIGVKGTTTTWHFSAEDVDLFKHYCLQETLPFLLPAIAWAIVGIYALRKNTKHPGLFPIMLFWLGTSLVGASAGRAWTIDYFLQTLLPLIIISALGFSIVFRQRRALASPLLSTMLVIGVALQFVAPPNMLTISEDENRPVIEAIQQYIQPEECIWTWGDIAWLRYFSGVRSCINYAYDGPLMIKESFDIYHNRVDYMQQLLANPPKLLVNGSPWSYFPMLQMYYNRYAREQVFEFNGIQGVAIDTSSWHKRYANYSNLFDLVGVDIFTPTVCSGENVEIALTWRVRKPVAKPYMLFVHIIAPETKQKVAEYNGVPSSQRPTETWMRPNEIILGDTLSLNIPNNTPPGTYWVISGFFDLELTPLLINGEGDSDNSAWIKIATIEVKEHCNTR